MADANDDKLQVYLTRRGRVVVRRPPRRQATPAQAAQQACFTAAARSAAGATMDRTAARILPPAAVAVMRNLANRRFSERVEEPGWKRVVRSWLRNRGYTELEAEVLLAMMH